MEGVTNVISSALENVITVFNSAVSMVTGQPIAMLFIGFSIAGAGVGFFKKLIRRR